MPDSGVPQSSPSALGSHVARCQECVDLLVDYLEGTLPAARARALEIHLDLCPACVGFLNTYRGTVDVARTLPVDEIPPELTSQLIAFLQREKFGRRPPAPA
jgi:anti-sigma factor RsiW